MRQPSPNPIVTRTITVDHRQAQDVRAVLDGIVRITVTERWHWVLWRRFTLSGPAADVGRYMAAVNARLDDEWWEAQW